MPATLPEWAFFAFFVIGSLGGFFGAAQFAHGLTTFGDLAALGLVQPRVFNRDGGLRGQNGGELHGRG